MASQKELRVTRVSSRVSTLHFPDNRLDKRSIADGFINSLRKMESVAKTSNIYLLPG